MTAEIRAPKENSIVQTSNSSPVLTVVGHESHTEYGVIVNKISRALLVPLNSAPVLQVRPLHNNFLYQGAATIAAYSE